MEDEREVEGQETKERRRLLPGLILILVGLGLLVLQVLEWPGWAFLAGLGVVFIVSAVVGRNLGLMIPGFILLGLGAGLAGATLLPPEENNWPLILLGLGLGFIAIWPAYSIPKKEFPWSLIPGGILTALGILFWMAVRKILFDLETLGSILYWWPAILVVIGAWIIYRWYVAGRG